MYFASHRSGVREILYKAQLYNIAYSIETVLGYSMIGYDLIYGNTMDDDEEYDEECEYRVVGSTESDPKNNKISDESPVGKALMGKKVGDEVIVEAPAGEIKLKVLAISK